MADDKKVKDRLVEYPNRFKLVNVETGEDHGTYDLVEVPGEITEEGTPVDAKLLNKLFDEAERAELVDIQIVKELHQEVKDRESDTARLEGLISDEQERAEAAEDGLQANIEAEEATRVSEIGRVEGLITAEETRATTREGELDAKIDAQNATLTGEIARIEGELDNEVSTRQSEITRVEGLVADEEERATAQEQILDDKIDAETNRAKGVEQANATAIAEEEDRATQEEARIAGLVSTEQARAEKAEGDLDNQIDVEIKRAKGVEETLEAAITAEQTRAEGAEQDITQSVTELTARVEKEETRAKNAESAVEGKITAETTRAQGEEQTLSAAIETEETRATAIENALDGRVSTIEKKIPTAATETNKLVDRDTMNSTIVSMAAFYRGSFETKAALDKWQTSNPDTATNNDYAYVQNDETHNHEAWRYIYVKKDDAVGKWEPQTKVNNAPLTADQVKALNSGITTEYVAKITENEQGIASEISRAQTAEKKNADAITAIQAKNTAQDTAIENAQNAANAAQDDADAANSSIITEVSRAKNAEEKNASDISALQTRMASVENKNTTQDTAITKAQTAAEDAQSSADNANSAITALGVRVSAVETKNISQDTAIGEVTAAVEAEKTRAMAVEKTNADAISKKADKTELSNYVTINTEQEITGKKTFSKEIIVSTRAGTTTLYPTAIAITNEEQGGNYIRYEPMQIIRGYSGDDPIYLDFPNETGTLALISDITWANLSGKPTIPDTSNFVTTDTDQTIRGSKSFDNIVSSLVGFEVLGGRQITAGSPSTAYKNGFIARHIPGRPGYTQEKNLQFDLPDTSGTLVVKEEQPIQFRIRQINYAGTAFADILKIKLQFISGKDRILPTDKIVLAHLKKKCHNGKKRREAYKFCALDYVHGSDADEIEINGKNFHMIDTLYHNYARSSFKETAKSKYAVYIIRDMSKNAECDDNWVHVSNTATFNMLNNIKNKQFYCTSFVIDGGV